MSESDFIPGSDPEFNIWQGYLLSLVEFNLVICGIAPDYPDAMRAIQAIWAAAFIKESNKRNL